MNDKEAFILAVITLVAAGCYKPESDPVIVEVPQTKPFVQRSVVGMSVENRPIECLVTGRGQDLTFILATIHGDEPAGMMLVQRLMGYLQCNPQLLQGRKVVIVPAANPDGVAKQTRHNASDVDLNRNFPADNRESAAEHGASALSEPEALAIEQIITKYGPQRIVSIHQFTETGPEALSELYPKGCIDYDGPAKLLAEHMAEHCDLPVEKLGAYPGSLGSYAGLNLGIPVVTVELPLHVHLLDSEALWERYGTALVAAIVYPNAAR